jgi:hypothetical protein
VYHLGAPDPAAPVVLTDNFLASVDAVHHALAGTNGVVILEDTGS